MKALVYRKKGEIEWAEFANPEIINPTDIIVKVEGFTFSHADYRPYLGEDDSVKANTIMGHEAVGVISAVGTAVTTLKIGDRVAVGCIIHCNNCSDCANQNYANCQNGGFILGTSENGTHAEYVRVPYGENSVIKIPTNLALEDVVMLSDVLPTAYENVIKKVDFAKIKTAAIIGDGPIGLSTFLFLINNRVKVDIYGHHQVKLDFFKANGAYETFTTIDKTNQKKYDLVVECVGNDRGTFEAAQQLLGFNGTLVTIGVFKNPVTFFLNELWYQNITIHTGILNVYTLPELLAKIENQEIAPHKIVSQIYDKDEVLTAYHAFKNKDLFKIVVKL
ncbi:alcohol dehydrogenase catalytic domain-containing protein [Spiroplasma chrysopicola]|uniref:Alcohol dehydrogenase n=1 Tax=Spiroplasma chrysopicola DF-1 TaxID=1276227 RepID=R4UH84_9MOLU|nr:alcohol dehydrogenase catalytic domain-containing protein [Spiroplasma chrysopicola]AGM24686.1 alcohol dehydrogenase [Spiroplasma chrysopicola DF-1]